MKGVEEEELTPLSQTLGRGRGEVWLAEYRGALAAVKTIPAADGPRGDVVGLRYDDDDVPRNRLYI